MINNELIEKYSGMLYIAFATIILWLTSYSYDPNIVYVNRLTICLKHYVHNSPAYPFSGIYKYEYHYGYTVNDHNMVIKGKTTSSIRSHLTEPFKGLNVGDVIYMISGGEYGREIHYISKRNLTTNEIVHFEKLVKETERMETKPLNFYTGIPNSALH